MYLDKKEVQKEERHVARLIERALEPYVTRLGIILEAGHADGAEEAIQWVCDAAEKWAKILLNPNEEAGQLASDIVYAIYGEDNDIPPTFWRTELGQTLFGAGGFPRRLASRVEVANVLGISVQRTAQIIGRHGLLTEGTKVKRHSLIREWKLRQGEADLRRIRVLAMATELQEESRFERVQRLQAGRVAAQERRRVELSHTDRAEEK